jgi:PAS domain S-box-containing protein
MNSNQSKVDREYNVPRPRRIYLLFVIVALVILGTMAYTLFTGNRISAKYAPLVDATMEIRFQGAQAHLWFEEVISGDPYKKIEEVLDFIDQADWYAQAILEGGSNPEGTFIPIKDPKIEEPIRIVRKDLAEFKKLTKQRLKIGKAAGIGSDVDQKYDAIFEHFLKQSDSVEKLIQNAMTQDLDRFHFSQVFLMLACLILSVAVGVLFHRLDRRRADAVVHARKEELRAGQNEKWLSTSLESMGDAVITTDPEGKVTYLNPVAESLTGWNRSDAKGVEITDVFNIANEETRKPVENPVSRVLREGIMVGLANHTVLITKDGEHIPIADSGAPIKDDQGHLMGVILVFHDILERKQAEEALRKYARIVATSKDHMALIDRNYIYQTVNAAALKAVKKSHEDIVGHSVAEIFGQEYFEKHQKPNIDRCLAGETVRYRTWINYPAYGRRYMEIDYSPYVEADESISGYVVNSRDITEQKKLEDQLRQAQKMEAIGTLAGGIAHDFNNILAAIMGYTDLALSDVEKETKLYENLQEVFQAGGRAKDMVKHILTFSRQAEQECKPVQIKLIVK